MNCRQCARGTAADDHYRACHTATTLGGGVDHQDVATLIDKQVDALQFSAGNRTNSQRQIPLLADQEASRRDPTSKNSRLGRSTSTAMTTAVAAPLSCYREPQLYARKPLLIMLTMASFTGNIA